MIVGVTFVLALASVGTRGEDTNPTVDVPPVVAPKVERPERPERPDKPGKPVDGERPSISDIKDVIKTFQEEKKRFIQEQKDQRSADRGKVREDLNKNAVVNAVRQEVKDSISDAKRQTREQAKKLAEEAKESAKEGRKRD